MDDVNVPTEEHELAVEEIEAEWWEALSCKCEVDFDVES